ncbi:MAG: hypothetical protein AAB316_04350 [Bacteroidota bacterium]
MPNNIEIIIGELFPQPATGSRVFASVYATQQVHGEMTVTDESGKARLKAPFELEMEGDALELDISDLPPGEYRVRIGILEEQWERRLRIEH